MEKISSSLLNGIENYYSDRIRRFGPTPQGVDWNGEEGQLIRFEQLAKIIEPHSSFSLNDLGTGYGAFFDFLLKKYDKFSFCGIDLSAEMISRAQERNKNHPQSRFIIAERPDNTADYSVASGVFNVKQNCPEDVWKSYVIDCIQILNESSRKGFSFNCLTKYSDLSKRRDHLFYADPCELFDFCKVNYSKNIALLHDYGLFEFTILVRK